MKIYLILKSHNLYNLINNINSNHQIIKLYKSLINFNSHKQIINNRFHLNKTKITNNNILSNNNNNKDNILSNNNKDNILSNSSNIINNKDSISSNSNNINNIIYNYNSKDINLNNKKKSNKYQLYINLIVHKIINLIINQHNIKLLSKINQLSIFFLHKLN